MTAAPRTGKPHLTALRRFALAITILNVLGHTVFGFEQSWAQPLTALATAYGMELLIELVEAWGKGRRPRFLGGIQEVVDFFLSAHITGLACAMLLYANDRLWPIAFDTAVAIGSKVLLRIRIGESDRHFYNPSNLGITVTLLLFPWIGIAPPYHFTENIHGVGSWLLPAIIVASGSFLNLRLTKRGPLIASWLTCFALQALVRSLIFGTPPAAAWLPMTGMAFLLFTFYMVTDPATTPSEPKAQVLFGAAVALAYCLLMVMHIVFGLFFALSIVCTLRGAGIWAYGLAHRKRAAGALPGFKAVVHGRAEPGPIQHPEAAKATISVAGGGET